MSNLAQTPQLNIPDVIRGFYFFGDGRNIN